MVVFQSPNRCHRDTRFCPFNIKCYCSPNAIIRLGPLVTPPLRFRPGPFPSTLPTHALSLPTKASPLSMIGVGFVSHHQRQLTFTIRPGIRLPN